MKHWWFCCHCTDFFSHLETDYKQLQQETGHPEAEDAACSSVGGNPSTNNRSKQRFAQSFHQRVQLVFDASQVIETTSRFLEAFSNFCFKSLRFWKFDVTFCVWRQATNFTFFKVNFCIITNEFRVMPTWPFTRGLKTNRLCLIVTKVALNTTPGPSLSKQLLRSCSNFACAPVSSHCFPRCDCSTTELS